MAACHSPSLGSSNRPTCPTVRSAATLSALPSVPTTPASHPAPKTATPITPAAMTGTLVLKNRARVKSSAASANRYTVTSTGFGGTKPLAQSTTPNSSAQTPPAYPASSVASPSNLPMSTSLRRTGRVTIVISTPDSTSEEIVGRSEEHTSEL